ncbi:hypothetical protein ABIE44_003217 [Marmoricola sp. OAE513]|uniref:hypothetical protein n=1 Tax=Marmoricola sp. OAE513 TaxID=2817894 RepID=UPI001AE6D169
MGANEGGRLWHVTLTVAGEAVEPMLVRGALSRLREERPFIDTVEFTASSAELRYWDEGEAMLDVASLALRLWIEHRESAGLPSWEIVGLEVVEKSVRDARSGTAALGAQAAAPLHFQL